MRSHIITNGTVINTIVASVQEAQTAYPNSICLDAAIYGGGIGWTWDGDRLIAPPPPPEPAPVVPTEITNWQAKKQLLIEGVYEQVNAAISTMDAAARIDWDHAAVFLRDYPLIHQMQALLGRSDAETDAYFVAASKLQ